MSHPPSASSGAGAASARERILSRLNASLQDPERPDTVRAEAVKARLAVNARGLVPARTHGLGPQGLVGLFAEQAEAVQATVLRADPGAVGQVLAAYLAQQGQPLTVRQAPDPELASYDLAGLRLVPGLPDPTEPVALTAAAYGIAETGTLMMLSGPTHPVGFNFLADTHLVVLPETRILASYEDAWDAAKQQVGRAFPSRTVNLITGPSRTADVEQKLELGAHGPRRLAIVLVSG